MRGRQTTTPGHTLTGLAEALERLGALLPGPVPAVELPVGQARGLLLAAPLRAGADLPAAAAAARDGAAVRAAGLEGAGTYTPVMVAQAARLALGAKLPPGTDAVVAARDIVWRGEHAELSQPVAAGEGVRAAGSDIAAGTVWRRQGARLSRWDLPLLAALGVRAVAVRVPRVAVLPTGAASADVSSACLAALLEAEGAKVQTCPPIAGRKAVAAALAPAAGAADLVIVTGGTGDGADDHTAAALADVGLLAVHGIGVRPGGTAGIGAIAGTPVILLPGSPADALGTWLLLGAPAVRRLAGAPPPPSRPARLARKLVSMPGLAELALLAVEDGAVLPLAVGDLPLAAFAAADAYVVVPAASEGYAEGNILGCHDL